MRISFCDRSSIVVVHDSCMYLWTIVFRNKILSLYGNALILRYPMPHGNHDKVLESVDNNDFHLNPNFCLYSSRKRYARIDSLREECRRFYKKPFSFSNSVFFTPGTTKFFHHLQLGLLVFIVWHSSRYGHAPLKTVAWMCRTQPQGRQSCSVLNVRTNNLSSDIRVVCFSPLLTL